MFLAVLKEWNNGISRGAQAKFARTIGVSKVTVMRWANGSLIPSEVQIKKMAKIFGKPENEITKIFEEKINIVGSSVDLHSIPVERKIETIISNLKNNLPLTDMIYGFIIGDFAQRTQYRVHTDGKDPDTVQYSKIETNTIQRKNIK